MSIESKVFLQLEKVQPSESKKVELGLTDDASSLAVLMNTLNTRIERAGDERDKMQAILDADGKKLLSALSEAAKLEDKIDALFKEIGLDAAASKDPKLMAMVKQMDRAVINRRKYNVA